MNTLRINQLERLLFFTITVLTLLPVLCFKFFPTMDGPAHLYNSNLINSLLFDNNETLHSFFIFNSLPVPNWTGHLILSIFNFFLPSFIAEKILLVFYVVGIAYSFRCLVLAFAPENIFFTYLIFPFIYSFFLFLGFYNFLLALVFMLLAIRYWIKHEDEIFSTKKILLLFSLILLTYFSHLLVFLLLIVFIGMMVFVTAFLRFLNEPGESKKIIIAFFKKVTMLLLVSIIPIGLTAHYFYVLPSNENKIFLSSTELVESLKNIRPIIAVNVPIEEPYAKKIFYILFGLLSIALFNKIRKINFLGNSPGEKIISVLKSAININDTWLLFSACILYLYFTMPDSDGAYGYVSHRLGLIFFICLSVWICIQPLPKWLMIVTAIVVLYCHFKLNQYYYSVAEELSKTASEYNSVSSKIQDNAVVMPLDYSGHWLQPHFSNYLVIDKPMIILENYECGLGWFPLKWNAEKMPTVFLGNRDIDNTDCFNWKWKSGIKNPPQKIDYVFVMGNMDSKTDSCTNIIKRNLNEHYQLIHTSDNCKLFKFKK